jgi:cytochrome P450
VTLVWAACETTPGAVAWAVAHLATQPAARDRLRAELASGSIGPDQIAALPYLDATVRETFRLSPVIAFAKRRLRSEMRLAGHDLAAGTDVAACIYLAHRRADAWPEPDRFLPERFLDGRANAFAYFPFGGGMRRCVGMHLATLETKAILSEVVANAALDLAPGQEVGVARGTVALRPRDGLRVVLRR